MRVTGTEIPGIVVVENKTFEDDRGWFMETWQSDHFHEQIGPYEFLQDNHSYSVRGVLRGLHYQIEQPQGKLVRVVRGEVFDVGVDLRADSETFGRWYGTRLSSENQRQLWIPPGFAHGFLTVSDSAELLYKCTDRYAPEHERTIIWNDEQIGIVWPIEEVGEVIVSQKDACGALFESSEMYR